MMSVINIQDGFTAGDAASRHGFEVKLGTPLDASAACSSATAVLNVSCLSAWQWGRYGVTLATLCGSVPPQS